MNSDNPLDPVWQSYEVMRDSLKISRRVISGEQENLLKGTKFAGSTENDAEERIRKSRNGAEDYVILSLWAVFERVILEYIQAEGRKVLDANPSEMNQRVHEKIEHEIEYWRAGDVLDIFKGTVDAGLLGTAKNIKKYRDWVAHRNEKRGQPPVVPPQTAYRILSGILDKLKTSAP